MFESIIKNKKTRRLIIWKLKGIRNYRDEYNNYHLSKRHAERIKSEIAGITRALLCEDIMTEEQDFTLEDIKRYFFETRVNLRPKEEVKREIRDDIQENT